MNIYKVAYENKNRGIYLETIVKSDRNLKVGDVVALKVGAGNSTRKYTVTKKVK